MRCKFKYGDRVFVDDKIGWGFIKSIRKELNKYFCVVKFDGMEMEYPESSLQIIKEPKTTCPLCNTEYKKTVFGNKTWKDCIPCGLTQEEAVKKWYNKDKKEQNSVEKLNKAWEQLSNSYNQSLDVSCLEDEESEQELDDYNYDFGWYVPNNQD